ncbi:MAG: hypothetical protein FJX77_03020 [Armatimonadetes bacterium]|nr:hypothetical protein [Armatimonadota bacterium]
MRAPERRRRLLARTLTAGAALACFGLAPADAQTPTAPPQRGWSFGGSFRLRQELWDWFEPAGGEHSYTFTASVLKLNATRRTAHERIFFELVQPTLIGLPGGASLPPPAGQLGLGAAYADANQGQDASLFVGQAYWEGSPFGSKDRLRLGRTEFSEGVEVQNPDPSLTWLHQERISQRLLGPFAFTHVSRRLDGLQFTADRGRTRYTLAGGIPTRGAFDLNGMDTLPEVRYAYASVAAPFSRKKPSGDARLFTLYYNDARDVVKSDNRPLPARAADTEGISLATFGGHAVQLWDLPTGRVDALLWAAGQVGEWGRLSHRAYAASAEVGYQPKAVPLRPWIRLGLNRYSGDRNPADGAHETFFPVLNTPRIYARFPFFTLANLNDTFVQLQLRPGRKWNLRLDYHDLRLADDNDLWYGGGGAFQDRPSFGLGGRPSGGNRDLARLLDLSTTYQPRRDTDLTLYIAYAAGGDVVGVTYRNVEGFYGYLELLRRF